MTLNGHLEIKVTEKQSRAGLTGRSARNMWHRPVSEDNAGPSYGPLLYEPSVYLTHCVLMDRVGNQCSSAPQVCVWTYSVQLFSFLRAWVYVVAITILKGGIPEYASVYSVKVWAEIQYVGARLRQWSASSSCPCGDDDLWNINFG